MPALHLPLFLLIILSLTSCGVVDSAGDDVNEGPSVSSADFTVNEQLVVVLDSASLSVKDDFSIIESYSWIQLSGEPVEINNKGSSQASFMAPEVLENEGVMELVFELTVTDNFDESSSGRLTVEVLPQNDQPVAGDDGEGNLVDEGASLDIGVVGNDTDADGAVDPAGIVIVTSPQNGTAVAGIDGTVAYAHNGSETLSDTFSYTVKDNEGRASNAATVTISVTPVNDPPGAKSDSANVNEGAAVTIAVLGNDSDPDSTIILSSISIVTPPANGTALPNANGTVAYSHNGSETISDSFTYTVQDDEGAISNIATVLITVNPVNDPPVANNDSANVDEGAVVNINVIGNDTDVDGVIDPATIAIVTVSANGVAVANSNGTVTYTHDGSETTSDNFTYTVQDDGGATSNVATVSITINPINIPPVANNDSANVDEGASVAIAVLGNDSDPDGTIAQSSISIVALPANGTALPNANGTVTYNHNGSETVSDSFTYTVQDNEGATSNVATVSITVNTVNDPPVADNDSANVDEGASVAIAVLGNDSDPDGTIIQSSISIGTSSANGTAVANANGTVTYTHDGSETTSDSFTYTVDDNGGATSNAATVSVSINPQNDPPVASGDSGSVEQSAVVTIAVLDNDSDPDGTINQSSISIVSTPANGTAVANANGTVTYTHDGSDTTSDSFNYTVDDDDGATSNTATVSLTITSLSASDAQSAGCWTTPQEQPLEASLADPQASASAMYSLVTDGAKGSVTVTDPVTGAFRYTPHAQGERGVDSFTYQIDDPLDELKTKTATVIVDPKIMIVGDSISAGLSDGANLLPATGQRVGFRQPLYETLLGENYGIDLVGGERDGEGVSGFDPDHEAHLDWTAAELAWGRNPGGSEGVFAWLEARPADLVLVHAGSYGLTSSVDQVSAMLDEIDRWEASANGNPVTVVVARIIDREPSDQNISLFNANLEAMVLERASNPAHPSYPDDVLVADLHGALSYPQDLSDGMHPSAQGYAKMAETWKKALTDNALLVRCP